MSTFENKSKKKLHYIVKAINKPHLNPQKLRRGIVLGMMVFMNIGFLAGLTGFYVSYRSNFNDVGSNLSNVAKSGAGIDLPMLGKIALGQVSDSQDLFPQVDITNSTLDTEFGKLADIKADYILPKFLNDNWSVVGRGDFGNFGKNDLLLFNKDKNIVVTFSIIDNRVSNIKSLPTIRDKKWKLVLTDDFNNDQNSDLVWRYDDEKDSKILLWTMKNNSILKQQWLAPDVQNLKDWKVVGSGNFDQNSVPDIVLSYTGNDAKYFGANLVSYLEGTGTIKAKDGVSVGWLPFIDSKDDSGNLTKSVVEVVDFNSDGFPDLVMNQNDKTKVRSQQGKLEVWLLKNTELNSVVNIENYFNLDWEPFIVDINQDGASDILWTNKNSAIQKCQGQTTTWIMSKIFRLEAKIQSEVNKCE